MLSTSTSRALRQFDCAIALVLLLALAGCTGGADQAAQIATGELPGLPWDHPAQRRAAAIHDITLTGEDAFEQSAGAVLEGQSMRLPAAEDAFEYVILRFGLGTFDPIAVDVNLTFNSGVSAFIAAGNYSNNAWEFFGSFAGDPSPRPLNSEHISPGGNVFILVLAWDATDVLMDTIKLSYDDNAVPAGHISGNVVQDIGGGMQGVTITLTPGGDQEVSNADGDYIFDDIAPGNYTLTPSLSGFSFEPASQPVTVLDGQQTNAAVFTGTADTGGPGISGTIMDGINPLENVKVVLIMYTGVNNIQTDESVLTDASGNYSFGALTEGTYRVIPLLNDFAFTPNRAPVMVDGAEVQDFSATGITIPATVTYNANMRPWLFEPICMNCHSSEFGPGQRNFAPSDVNWDTYDGTTLLKKQLGNTRVQGNTMPPIFLLDQLRTTTFQRDLFDAWSEDGFPEN